MISNRPLQKPWSALFSKWCNSSQLNLYNSLYNLTRSWRNRDRLIVGPLYCHSCVQLLFLQFLMCQEKTLFQATFYNNTKVTYNFVNHRLQDLTRDSISVRTSWWCLEVYYYPDNSFMGVPRSLQYGPRIVIKRHQGYIKLSWVNTIAGSLAGIGDSLITFTIIIIIYHLVDCLCTIISKL